MSSALGTITNALNSTGSQIAKATSNIVNASSTGGNFSLASSLIGLKEDEVTYAAQAKLVNAVAQDNQRLLDIFA